MSARVPTYFLDEVAVSVLPSYLRANGADEEAHLRQVLTSFAEYMDRRGGRGSVAAEARALGRAEVVASVVQNRREAGAGGGGEGEGGEEYPAIVLRAAGYRPRHGGDGGGEGKEDDLGEVWEALKPSDYEEIEAGVLAGYLYHMEMESEASGEGGGGKGDKVEAYLQFFAGNVFQPAYLGSLAKWYSRLDTRNKDVFVVTMRRLQGALSRSSLLRASFPWRTALFRAYVSPDVLEAKAAAAALPVTGSFADMYATGASASFRPRDNDNDNQGANGLDLTAQYEAGENGRPASPEVAGLSTRKINLQRNDASSSRFDAHGQTTLTQRELNKMLAEGRRPEPAKSVYAQSYEWNDAAAKRAFSTCYTKDLQKSVKLGLDKEMRLETTYMADVGRLGDRVMATNAELGIIPDYEVTEPYDQAYARLVQDRVNGKA